MIRIGLDRRWRVDLLAELDLPMGADVAWQSVCDFRRLACMDLFHKAVHLDEAEPGAGVTFVLDHRLAFFRVSRVGRILRWKEGESYAFSDLSRRGPQAGFPHIYVYEVVPVAPDRCRFRLAVRGRWTARFIPRGLVRVWLGGIMLKTRTSIRNALLWDHLRSLLRERYGTRVFTSGASVDRSSRIRPDA